jgi:predicted nucleic acid-binding protein
MVHLDTGLLIAACDATDVHHAIARKVLARPGSFAASSVAWMEFHSRPLERIISDAMRGLLSGGIISFDAATARLAGELYYKAGSSRRTRMDVMIAATAILAGAHLSTVNREDFEAFVPFGLKLLR